MNCSSDGCYSTIVHSVRVILPGGTNVIVPLCCVHRMVEVHAKGYTQMVEYDGEEYACWYHDEVILPPELVLTVNHVTGSARIG